jgi:hypothetical protein
MSKILVVQPYKMLQHAIGLALFPQHQTRMTGSIPDSTEIGDVDAAIIDAAALRETDSLSAQAIRSLERWKIPIIWIDTADSQLTPTRANFVVMDTPIAKQTLQSALAQCLGDSPGGRRKNMRQTGRDAISSRHRMKGDKGVKREVIDLVEVVEEGPESHKTTSELL